MKDYLTAKDRMPSAREILAVKRCILKDMMDEFEELMKLCKSPEEMQRLILLDELTSSVLYGSCAGWLNDLFMGKRT